MGASCSNLGKHEFSWGKGLCEYLNIRIIYHYAKNQKKLPIPEKNSDLTDGRTNGQTDGQTTMTL